MGLFQAIRSNQSQPEHVTVTRRGTSPFQSASPFQQAQPVQVNSRLKYVAALAAAGISDALSVAVEVIPPLEIAVDISTALVIWALLGWRWTMLVALVAEAIPGLALFPTWIMVVLAYGMFPKGSATPPPPPQRP
jgi:hypothetical protein